MNKSITFKNKINHINFKLKNILIFILILILKIQP